MCGIVALINANPSSDDAGAELHEALYLLQHRGQDACGIATCGPGGKFYQCKGNGMASAVFKNGERVNDLPGYMGLGHLRYPTVSGKSSAESQPLYVNSPYGIALSHNGNLINALQLKEHLDKDVHRHINTDSDSELMLNIFANELSETGKFRVNENDIFAALSRMYEVCVGGWACTAMLAGFGVIGFRDAYGIRPLIVGSRPSASYPGKKDWMMASESVALEQRGFYDDFQDIMPGQAIIIPKGGADPIFREVQKPKKYAPDIFEYVYFARPDTVIDGISVQESRENMGYKLAETIKRTLTEEQLNSIDAIVPVPETAIASAACVAERLQKPFCQGFVKNRYVFRTFIMPGQKLRENSVRRKLNAMKVKFKDRCVLLVDDSVVRGTTSRSIISMAREAGARRIFFASCAPRITDPHIYGIDLASKSELIAHHRTERDIAEHIGAEEMIFQRLEDLIDACQECTNLMPDQPRPKEFEIGVFSGNYITPVENGYFEHLDVIRGEAMRQKTEAQARLAVASGRAGREELEIATKGASINGFGFIVPNTDPLDIDHVKNENKTNNQKRPNFDDATGKRSPPSRHMDMSLHNIADF